MNLVSAYQADLVEARAAEARADAADLRRRADQLDQQAERDEAVARSLRAGQEARRG